MNHRIGGRKFGLPSDQRRALLKGLVRALFTYQTIKTTETRAKDVRSIAEKLITGARVDTPARSPSGPPLPRRRDLGASPVHADRAGVQDRAGWLYPYRQDRPAPGRCCDNRAAFADHRPRVRHADGAREDRPAGPCSLELSWRELHRLKLTIEYDGTEFCGFQRQAQGERTVQSVLEQAIETAVAARRDRSARRGPHRCRRSCIGTGSLFGDCQLLPIERWAIALNSLLPA